MPDVLVKGKSKYARKSDKAYKVGKENDPVMQKAEEVIKQGYREGFPVKFTELAKKIGITRANLIRRSDALVNSGYLLKVKRKYYRPVTDADARKNKRYSFLYEFKNFMLECQKKKQGPYQRIRPLDRVFAFYILPASKQERPNLDRFCADLEKLVKKHKIRDKKAIGFLLNWIFHE